MNKLSKLLALMLAIFCLASFAVADEASDAQKLLDDELGLLDEKIDDDFDKLEDDLDKLEDQLEDEMDKLEDELDQKSDDGFVETFVDEDGNEIPPPPMGEDGMPLPPPLSDEEMKGLDNAIDHANEHAQEVLHEAKEVVDEHADELLEQMQQSREDAGMFVSDAELGQLKDDAVMCAVELGRKDDMIMGLELKTKELEEYILANGLELPELSDEAEALLDTEEFDKLVGANPEDLEELAEAGIEGSEPTNLLERFFGFFKGDPASDDPEELKSIEEENGLDPLIEGLEPLDESGNLEELEPLEAKSEE